MRQWHGNLCRQQALPSPCHRPRQGNRIGTIQSRNARRLQRAQLPIALALPTRHVTRDDRIWQRIGI